MATILGIRIGSQKTVVIANDAEILLTESGGVSHPSLISLDSKLRLFGEEASPYFSNNSTYTGLNQILYHSVSSKNIENLQFPQCDRMFNHRDYKFSYENNRLQIHVSALVDESSTASTSTADSIVGSTIKHDGYVAAVSLIGMYIQTLKERALSVYTGHSEHTSHANKNDLHFAFAIPPGNLTLTLNPTQLILMLMIVLVLVLILILILVLNLIVLRILLVVVDYWKLVILLV